MTSMLETFGLFLQGAGWIFLPFLLLPFLCLLFPKVRFFKDLQRNLNVLINGFNIWAGEVVKWLLVLMVVVTAFSVIALSIFGQSWTKVDESVIYMHASVIMLGSAATLLAGQHVRVDIFYAKMSPRTRALVELIGFYALMLPFCLILLWNAQTFVHLSWSSFEGSYESDGIRGVYLLKTLIPLFALMMLAQGFAIAGRAALYLSGHSLPELPPGIEDPFGDEHQEAGL